MKAHHPVSRWLSLLAAIVFVVALGHTLVSAEEHGVKQTEEAIRKGTKATLSVELEEQSKEAGAPAGSDVKNPMVTDPDLAIYTAVVFGILMLVLGKFAWGPIAAGLDHRERTIREQIEAAERTQIDARNLLAEYERRLAAAGDEVRGLLDTARRDAANVAQEVHNKALAEAEAVKDRALRDIETAKGSALKELAEQSSRLAISLAGRIVQAELDPSRHNRLIEEAMSRFPAGSANKN